MSRPDHNARSAQRWRHYPCHLILDYWRRLGHEVAGEQYVADSGFARVGSGRNNLVADGVVFVPGHRPKPRETTHDEAVIHAVVEAVSDRSEDRIGGYAALGIERYWIFRGDADADEVDGMITMHELRPDGYEVTGHRLVSRLSAD